MITELRLDMREHNERSIRIEGTMNQTLAQAIKTNGRVSALESKNTLTEGDITKMKTVFYTLSTVLSIVWAGVTFFIE